MNKKAVIGIGVAAVAAIVIGAVWFTQGANLKAAMSVAKSAAMDEEAVAAKTEENAQIEQEIREQYQIPDLALSDEMQAAIADGTMTLEEVAQSLLSDANAQASFTAEPSPAQETPSGGGQADSGQAEAPEPSDNGQTEPPGPYEPETPQSSDSGQAEAPEPYDDGQTEPLKPYEPETPSDSGQVEAPEPYDDGQTEPPKPYEPETPSDSRQTDAETPSDKGQTEAPQPSDSGRTEAPKPSDSGRTEAPQKTDAEKAEEEKNARVQNLITQLYLLRSSFSARVDAIIDECVQEFLALDPSQQNRTSKIRIVYSRMSDLEAMESECDAQVEAIAAQLDEIDPSLGAKARQQYQNEKELKKASLISQYGG